MSKKIKNKACFKCGEEKPATTEYFYWRKNRNSLHGVCKVCAAIRHKAYYDANREACCARARTYQRTNREATLARHKAYYQKNKEERNRKSKIYYRTNKEAIKKQKKIYREANIEAHLEWCRAYRKENKEKILQINKTYYKQSPRGRWLSIKHGAKARGLVFALPFEVYEAMVWKKPCHYCGGKTVNGVDRKDNNEGYTIDNVVPCCSSCNTRKWTKTYERYLAEVNK